jgi:hypothetical protein
MQKAVAMVEKGESIRRAAELHGVPRSTLHDIVVGKVNFDAHPGKKPYLTISEEEEIVHFLQKCATIGYPRTRQQVLALVQAIMNDKGIECGVSEGWWRRFNERHPDLAIRTAIPLSQARAMATDRVIIGKYFDLLEETLNENKIMNVANQIFNCDETGMPLSLKPLKVIDSRGSKHPSYITSDSKEQITVLVCASASGATIPPFIIFNRKSLHPELAINEIPGTFYGLSSKGWIDGELFYNWFKHHFLAYIPPIRPTLLLLDGHSSHYSPDFVKLAASEQVIVFVLPPNHSTT